MIRDRTLTRESVRRRDDSLKLLHIGPDTIFLSHFSSWIEKLRPEESEYLVLAASGQSAPKHPIASPQTRFVTRKWSGIFTNFRKIRSADVLIAHSMSRFAAMAFLISRPDARRVWSGFGYDYYGQEGREFRELLGPRTNNAVSWATAPMHGLGARLTRWLFRRAASRASHFSAPIRGDLSVFRRAFPEFDGDYIQLKYATMSEMEIRPKPVTDGSILVGNSAAPTNNHLDIFAWLSNIDTQGRDVLVPLSYDGDPRYVDIVIAEGEENFGSHFRPIVDFMPLTEYLETIGRAEMIVMGQRRQKALGNIIASVHAGAALVLDPSSPMAPFFAELGVTFFTMDELVGADIGRLLTESQRRANAKALEDYYGEDVVLEELDHILIRLAASGLKKSS